MSDIGQTHLIAAYAATIGIHVIYVTYVAVKFRRSGKKSGAA